MCIIFTFFIDNSCYNSFKNHVLLLIILLMHWKKLCRIYIETICTQKLLADFTNNYKETETHGIKQNVKFL